MHICSFFKGEEQQLSAVAPFVLSGLAGNEKCIYITGRSDREDLVDAFPKTEDVQKSVDSGQLEFLSFEQGYLKDGRFDHNRMLKLLRDAEQKALAEGYSGLTVTGEMDWYNTKAPGVDQIMEYESRINYMYPGTTASILCQYDESRFNPGLLMDMVRTHPKVILEGTLCHNPYFTPPDDFLKSLRGEVAHGVFDRASVDILRRARIASFRELERAALKQATRRSNVLSDVALNDIHSQVAVTRFYAELALDSDMEDNARGYLADLLKSCDLMEQQIAFLSESQRISEDEPGWQSVADSFKEAARSLGIRSLRVDESIRGLELNADPLLSRAFMSMLEFVVAGAVRPPPIEVSGAESQEGLKVALLAHRRGVPEAAKEAIFRRGYRDGERTWYCLSLAREVLEASGCTVQETGDPSECVRFEILAPKQRFRRK
jgi:hypothetical protein